jgi:hypothetical protein
MWKPFRAGVSVARKMMKGRGREMVIRRNPRQISMPFLVGDDAARNIFTTRSRSLAEDKQARVNQSRKEWKPDTVVQNI